MDDEPHENLSRPQNWAGAFEALFVMAMIAVIIAIMAQCESGAIW